LGEIVSVTDDYMGVPKLLGRHVSRMYPQSGWVRRVVGTIWNVGAGDPRSLPVRNANSRKPLKVD